MRNNYTVIHILGLGVCYDLVPASVGSSQWYWFFCLVWII